MANNNNKISTYSNRYESPNSLFLQVCFAADTDTA